jgi:DNA-directed RNA polymerase subunit M/transcription elongation factor TFIIS
MAENTIECPKCGVTLAYQDEHVGTTITCPSCGARLELFWPEDEAPAEPPAPTLPERMKANRLVEGRTCPTCGQGVFFGQDVHNCQTCGQTYHDACWGSRGCATCDAPIAGPAQPPAADAPTPLAPALPVAEPDQKECRFCGEMILVAARKCRHCGEYQNESDRRQAAGPKEVEEENLTAGEWLLAILCSGIGCIVGIVWLCQGKKKGWKMIAVSIVANIILKFIITMLRS